jgi:hypothetical protein
MVYSYCHICELCLTMCEMYLAHLVQSLYARPYTHVRALLSFIKGSAVKFQSAGIFISFITSLYE